MGSINGQGAYALMLTATDGQMSGGGGVDNFRITIWSRATGGVVYDNKIGSADDSENATALDGGRIVIHQG